MKVFFGLRAVDKSVGLEGREMWNVIIISLSFLSVFTAYLTLQNLQSSLNQEEGLGVISLSCLYAFIIVSAIGAPWVIKIFGIKISLLVSWFVHIIYTCCNFYPTFGTLIPSSVLMGAISGPLWTAQSVFITANAFSLADRTKGDNHGLLSKMNGIFFTFYELTQISGNLASSLVFNQAKSNSNSSSSDIATCGVADCPYGTGNTTSTVEEPPQSTVYTVLYILLAFDVLGFFILAAFLPPIQSNWVAKTNTKRSLIACFGTLLDPKLFLLVPFIMIMAMEQAVLWTDFTKSYISCPIGVQMVGFVMTCYGGSTAVSAFVTSRIAKYTGRYILFGLAASIDMAIFVILYLWTPNEDQVGYLFAIAAAWGLAEGMWQAQSNALIALLFPDKTEPAFANYHCWKATSFTIYFVISTFLCVYTKLILVMTLLSVAMVLYVGVEISVCRSESAKPKDEAMGKK